MNPLILNKHKAKVIPADAIYIGRGSMWGNPFPITRDQTRAMVIAEHKHWLANETAAGRITNEQLATLHGKHLVCFCAPSPCHGETLIEAAAQAVANLNQTKEKQMNEFKLIVAGGRDFMDYDKLHQEVMTLANGEYADKEVSIVSGVARGADELAIRFAEELGVELHTFPAKWDKFGKGAGHIRNREMAEFADGALCFWDGASKGTANMIQEMQKLGKPVHIVMYKLVSRSAHPQFMPQGRFTKVKQGG